MAMTLYSQSSCHLTIHSKNVLLLEVFISLAFRQTVGFHVPIKLTVIGFYLDMLYILYSCPPVQVNIFNTTTTNSPKADGLNAMQSWVICCIFFVFGALFEYAIILLQMKIKTFRKLTTPMQKDETCKMDVAVLIAFPIIFLIFNVVYWAAFHF